MCKNKTTAKLTTLPLCKTKDAEFTNQIFSKQDIERINSPFLKPTQQNRIDVDMVKPSDTFDSIAHQGHTPQPIKFNLFSKPFFSFSDLFKKKSKPDQT